MTVVIEQLPVIEQRPLEAEADPDPDPDLWVTLARSNPLDRLAKIDEILNGAESPAKALYSELQFVEATYHNRAQPPIDYADGSTVTAWGMRDQTNLTLQEVCLHIVSPDKKSTYMLFQRQPDQRLVVAVTDTGVASMHHQPLRGMDSGTSFRIGPNTADFRQDTKQVIGTTLDTIAVVDARRLADPEADAAADDSAKSLLHEHPIYQQLTAIQAAGAGIKQIEAYLSSLTESRRVATEAELAACGRLVVQQS